MSNFVLHVLHSLPDWVFSAYAALAGLILALALFLAFPRSTRRLAVQLLCAVGAAVLAGCGFYWLDVVPAPPITATEGLQALASGFGHWLDRIHLAYVVSAIILLAGLAFTALKRRMTLA